MNFLLVFLGGGFGSLLRYSISKLFPVTNYESFPIATFLSNIAACLFMGIVILFLRDKTDTQNWQLFFITGVCGGFSTFSTFSLETIQLVQAQQYMYAGLNIFLSVISCLIILYLFVKTN
jgi:CrcB protein